MNEPAALLLRSTIFMDLRGESPIGAWATPDDCPEPSKSKQPDRKHGQGRQTVKPFTAPRASEQPTPGQPRSGTRGATGKDAPQEIKEISGVPGEVVLTSCFL